MNKKYTYTTILIHGPNKGVFAEFPFDSVFEFGTRKPVRVKAVFEGKTYYMSMLPNGKGGHWMHVKKDIRQAIGKEEGDIVHVAVEKDNSPKTVEIPEYLQWLLENDPVIFEYYRKLPYSAKKFWISFIEEPKNDDKKVERINRLFEYLREHYSKR